MPSGVLWSPCRCLRPIGAPPRETRYFLTRVSLLHNCSSRFDLRITTRSAVRVAGTLPYACSGDRRAPQRIGTVRNFQRRVMDRNSRKSEYREFMLQRKITAGGGLLFVNARILNQSP